MQKADVYSYFIIFCAFLIILFSSYIMANPTGFSLNCLRHLIKLIKNELNTWSENTKTTSKQEYLSIWLNILISQ